MSPATYIWNGNNGMKHKRVQMSAAIMSHSESELNRHQPMGHSSRQTPDTVGRGSEYARSLIEARLNPLVTIRANGKITDVNEAAGLI